MQAGVQRRGSAGHTSGVSTQSKLNLLHAKGGRMPTEAVGREEGETGVTVCVFQRRLCWSEPIEVTT